MQSNKHNNTMKEDTIEVKMNMPKPPEGYEYTGEYRPAKEDEPWIDPDSGVLIGETVACFPILRKTKWKPEEGERYYFVDEMMDVQSYHYESADLDNFLITAGNCFKTQEEAHEMAAKFRKVLQND